MKRILKIVFWWLIGGGMCGRCSKCMYFGWRPSEHRPWMCKHCGAWISGHKWTIKTPDFS